MKSEKVMRLLGENLDKITRYGVRRIGLFGSYIRDEQTENSDIDILVEFEKNKKTFDNYMELKFFLEDLFECKIDLVVREAIKPSLKEYIMGSVKYAEGL